MKMKHIFLAVCFSVLSAIAAVSSDPYMQFTGAVDGSWDTLGNWEILDDQWQVIGPATSLPGADTYVISAVAITTGPSVPVTISRFDTYGGGISEFRLEQVTVAGTVNMANSGTTDIYGGTFNAEFYGNAVAKIRSGTFSSVAMPVGIYGTNTVVNGTVEDPVEIFAGKFYGSITMVNIGTVVHGGEFFAPVQAASVGGGTFEDTLRLADPLSSADVSISGGVFKKLVTCAPAGGYGCAVSAGEFQAGVTLEDGAFTFSGTPVFSFPVSGSTIPLKLGSSSSVTIVGGAGGGDAFSGAILGL